MKSKFGLKSPFLPTIADLANLREVERDIEAYGNSKKGIDGLEKSLVKIIELHGSDGQWIERSIGALHAIANKRPYSNFSYERQDIASVSFYCTNCDSMEQFKFPAILGHRCGTHPFHSTADPLDLVKALAAKVGLAWKANNFIVGTYPRDQAFECAICSGDAVDASKRQFLDQCNNVSAYFPGFPW